MLDNKDTAVDLNVASQFCQYRIRGRTSEICLLSPVVQTVSEVPSNRSSFFRRLLVRKHRVGCRNQVLEPRVNTLVIFEKYPISFDTVLWEDFLGFLRPI